MVLVSAALVPARETPEDADARLADEAAKLEVLEGKLASLEDELSRLGDRKSTLLGELHRLDLQVRVSNEQLALHELSLERGYREIDEHLGHIEELEASIASLAPYLAGRSVSLYKLGKLSYVRLLLSVEEPSELTRAYRYISRLASEDASKMHRFLDDQTALERTKQALTAQTELMLATRKQLEATSRTLDSRRASRRALLEDVGNRQELAGTLVSELESARERLGMLVDDLVAGETAEVETIHLPMRAFEGEIGWPVSGELEGRFGRQLHPRFKTVTVRNGIEIEAEPGDNVNAVYDGEVVFASWFQGYGKLLILRHPGNVHSLYGFLSDFAAAPGDWVSRGEHVAFVGDTGSLSGPRLYFEIRVLGSPVDPETWLDPERKLASATTAAESN